MAMPVAVVTEATGSFRPSTPLLSMSICLCHENNPKRGMKKKVKDIGTWRDDATSLERTQPELQLV